MPKKNYGVSNFQTGKKFIPGEALAFKHLDSEVTTVKVAFFREALIEVLWPRASNAPLQKIIWGNKFPWKNGEISGDFSMGKTKTPVFFEVYYRDYCSPIIP